MTLFPQVLVLFSDTGQHGQMFLSIPRHSQTPPKTPPRQPPSAQEAPKTAQRPSRGPQKHPQSDPRAIFGTFKNRAKFVYFQFFSNNQPLVFVSFTMLIKSELQMAFRSVQKRPRRLQDARPPPTWSQQEKRQDRSQGSRNLVPRGSEIRIAARSQHAPKMDSKMDPTWAQNGPQNIPRMDSKSTPKPTSDGPSIDSQIDFKAILRSVPRSSYSRAELPCR